MKKTVMIVGMLVLGSLAFATQKEDLEREVSDTTVWIDSFTVSVSTLTERRRVAQQQLNTINFTDIKIQELTKEIQEANALILLKQKELDILNGKK